MKRIVSLFFCFSLLISLFAACAKEVPQTASPPVVSAVISAPVIDSYEDDAFDVKTAFAILPADTVMLTVGGDDVAWDEYFFYLFKCYEAKKNAAGGAINWAMTNEDGEIARQEIYEDALQGITECRAIEKKAAQVGVVLTDADRAQIQANFNKIAEGADGREKFIENINGNGCSERVFIYLLEIDFLNRPDLFSAADIEETRLALPVTYSAAFDTIDISTLFE